MVKVNDKKSPTASASASNASSESVKPKVSSSLKPKKIHNWYADRYLSLLLQRNLLFLFAAMSCIGVLVALTVIKSLYEQKSIDPYLIEVDKRDHIMTIVEHESHKTYTAQESIKEYFLSEYLNARESYKPETLENNMNTVRVMSSKEVYKLYLKDLDKMKNTVKNVGRGATATLGIGQITYITPTRVELKCIKRIVSEVDASRKEEKFGVVIAFNFANIPMTLDDRRINPLGFQVVSYMKMPERSLGEESKSRT